MQLNYEQIAQDMRKAIEQNLMATQKSALQQPMAEIQTAARLVVETMATIDLDDPESCAAVIPDLYGLMQTAYSELGKVERIRADYVTVLDDPRTHSEIIARYKKATGADWIEQHTSPGGCAVIPALDNREFSSMTIAEVVRACLPEIKSALRQFSRDDVHAFFVAKGLRGKKNSFYQAISIAQH
jgi:hypothetical protein